MRTWPLGSLFFQAIIFSPSGQEKNWIYVLLVAEVVRLILSQSIKSIIITWFCTIELHELDVLDFFYLLTSFDHQTDLSLHSRRLTASVVSYSILRRGILMLPPNPMRTTSQLACTGKGYARSDIGFDEKKVGRNIHSSTDSFLSFLCVYICEVTLSILDSWIDPIDPQRVVVLIRKLMIMNSIYPSHLVYFLYDIALYSFHSSLRLPLFIRH